MVPFSSGFVCCFLSSYGRLISCHFIIFFFLLFFYYSKGVFQRLPQSLFHVSQHRHNWAFNHHLSHGKLQSARVSGQQVSTDCWGVPQASSATATLMTHQQVSHCRHALTQRHSEKKKKKSWSKGAPPSWCHIRLSTPNLLLIQKMPLKGSLHPNYKRKPHIFLTLFALRYICPSVSASTTNELTSTGIYFEPRFTCLKHHQ